MGKIILFPTVDTFEVKFDMGRWSLVRWRQGRLVERSYWPDRDCAEYMANYFTKHPDKRVASFNKALPDWAILPGDRQ